MPERQVSNHDNMLIAKNSFILLIRFIVTSILGLFSLRLVIQGLGTSDYGLYVLIGGFVTILVFLNSVMSASTYRFIAVELGAKNLDGVNKILNISLFIHFSIGMLVFLLAETIGVYYVKNHLNVESQQINDSLFILRFSAYAAIVNVISVPFQGLLVAKENFRVIAITEILRSGLGLIVALMTLNYDANKLQLFAMLTFLINCVPSFIYFIYCKQKYKGIFRLKFQRDIKKYQEMISFSGWITLGGLAGIAKNSGAAIIINRFFGTVLNASFGISIQVNNMVQLLSNSLGQAAIPQITKSYSGGDSNRTINLTIYLTKYTFFLMLIPALPILLETEFILTLWLGASPPYAATFVRLVIINSMMDSLGGVGAIAQAAGRIKYFQIVLSVTSLLSLPIAYVLFELNCLPQTIIVVFIATSLINLISSIMLLKRILKFDVMNYLNVVHKRIFFVLFLIVWLFGAKGFFAEGWIRFGMMIISSTFILILSVYLVGLEQKEKIMVASFYREYLVKKLAILKK
jgi:O-antigen/teichoic acid export membrane protein